MSEEVSIVEVLSREQINLNMQVPTKERAICELTRLLVNNKSVSNRNEFYKDVLARENEGITGLGQGIAIPHGKSKAVVKTSIAVGISKQPIPWESLDGKPVHVIILFAVRDDDASTLHIRLLQKVATLLADDDFVTKLHMVTTKKELIKLFELK